MISLFISSFCIWHHQKGKTTHQQDSITTNMHRSWCGIVLPGAWEHSSRALCNFPSWFPTDTSKSFTLNDTITHLSGKKPHSVSTVHITGELKHTTIILLSSTQTPPGAKFFEISLRKTSNMLVFPSIFPSQDRVMLDVWCPFLNLLKHHKVSWR